MSAVWRIMQGDCRELLAPLDAGSVQTCITSPPYFGLRDYGHTGQIGAERSLVEYVDVLRWVFREVRRVLADDGTLWLNLGDCYDHRKSLIGVPWRVAQRLKQDGWVLRSDIIWAKPNPMPESVTDRPTKAHEYLFLLAKGPRYFYNADAIREEWESNGTGVMGVGPVALDGDWQGQSGGSRHKERDPSRGRNKRSVWTVPVQPFNVGRLGQYVPAHDFDHFASFPKLIEPCVLAGSRLGDLVLDPFAGSGTTGMVALRHGRSFVGCELNPEYARLARDRIIADAPLLNTPAEVAA